MIWREEDEGREVEILSYVQCMKEFPPGNWSNEALKLALRVWSLESITEIKSQRVRQRNSSEDNKESYGKAAITSVWDIWWNWMSSGYWPAARWIVRLGSILKGQWISFYDYLTCAFKLCWSWCWWWGDEEEEESGRRRIRKSLPNYVYWTLTLPYLTCEWIKNKKRGQPSLMNCVAQE